MSHTYYDRDGQQHSSRAERVFFIYRWVPEAPKGEIRAIARAAAFSQFGHFMMGTIRVGGKSITVSGGEDLDFEHDFGGWWPVDSCVLDGEAYAAWNSDRLKSSATLSAVGKHFPALAACLREARKTRRRRRVGPPQRVLP